MRPGGGDGAPQARRARSDGAQGAVRSGRLPELDCVRDLLPRAVIDAAERRAAALGTGADRVLIAAGMLDEETYVRALCGGLGVAFEPLNGFTRTRCPLSDDRLIGTAANGLLPLTGDAGLTDVVIAPRGIAARSLIRLVADDPARGARIRLTTGRRFTDFILRGSRETLVERATHRLAQTRPMMAAGTRPRRGILAAISMAVLMLGAATLVPATTLPVIEVTLATLFLAWLALRLTGAFMSARTARYAPDLPDRALPIYTIAAALYREAASVQGLLAAIEKLDYPPEKLDVILAVEADDRETLAALAALKLRMPVTVIPVPAGGPRTKPKALNVALPFARGTFIVIYDAEDRPEPNQLRRALQAFGAGGSNLACVQARLCIDNTADSWLARYFTAEYAGQFDVFLPGITALGLPLPLGGSSNHFYTATLRKVGGWDAHNVTEDADLGMRLARCGYRAAMIDSTTYEEAPAYAGAWLRQRTRWFKGWMQTWLVHMRQPRRLLRELGAAGFIGFHLMVGGNVLAALVHPLFIGAFVYSTATTGRVWSDDTITLMVLAALYGTTMVFGYLSSAFIGWLGLARRGLLTSAWVLLLTPLHWVLLSLAAWRAVYQLIVAPQVWEKTEHGLARTSQRAERMSRALIELEREVRVARGAGLIPVVGDATDTSASRRRTLRASA